MCFTENVADYHCPRWPELPSVPLYMDQVVIIVEEAAGTLAHPDEKGLTPAMVNNYVKQRLMPPPIKKRYSREQLAFLIIVSILKKVLPIGDISQILSALQELYGIEQCYNLFCERLEEMLKKAFPGPDGAAITFNIAPGADGVLDAALAALAGRLIVETLLPAAKA